MLILDQRTMQIKYRWVLTITTVTSSSIITVTSSTPVSRVPAGEIFKLSLSPYFDDIAVFHVRAVSCPPSTNIPIRLLTLALLTNNFSLTTLRLCGRAAAKGLLLSLDQ